LETLLVLVLILFEEIGRSWPLIPDMPYLFFRDISLFPFLGPIVWISLFIPGGRRNAGPAILMLSAKSNYRLADQS
jgi:hypothetical protein